MFIRDICIEMNDGSILSMNGDGESVIKILQALSKLEDDNESIRPKIIELAKVAVRAFLSSGKTYPKIEAIKKYRQVCGVTLKEAKEAVEDLIRDEFPNIAKSYPQPY